MTKARLPLKNKLYLEWENAFDMKEIEDSEGTIAKAHER